MQVFVKTLKGTHFEIEVKPDDTVADVKKNIETSQGQNVYPADQQMLIHQGKVLKDETTLAENNVADKTFIVVMLRKGKGSSSGALAATPAPSSQPPPASSASANPSTPPRPPAAITSPAVVTGPATVTTPALASTTPTSTAEPVPVVTASETADAYDQAASNLVAGNNLEQAIQEILEIGGGTWDRETVVRAMRAAFNNPERAVDYLYSLESMGFNRALVLEVFFACNKNEELAANYLLDHIHEFEE